LQTFDDLRSWLGTGRRWGVVAWLIPLAILVAIGALGGRKWRSRLLWAAAVLAIMALLAYILYGPLFSAMVQPEIDSALMQVVGQAEGFQALVVDKGITIAQNAVDSFIGGLKLQALVLLIASVVLIVLVSVWHIWVRKRSGLATDESNSTEAH